MKKWIIIAAVATVLLLAFSVFAKKKGWIGGDDFTKVAVEQAQKREIIGLVSATGKIYPASEVNISPDVPGEIVELFIEEGDSVKEGQILARIDADDYATAIDRSISTLNNTKANVEQAQAGIAQSRAALEQSKARVIQADAQVDNAKQELDRNKSLYNEQLISLRELQASELQYNTAVADLAAAKQAVKSAEENVNASQASKKASEYSVRSVGLDVKQARTSYQRTIIRAPHDGIVSKLNIEKGERVVGTSQMAGTEMMTISDLKNMECRIEVSENDIVRVELGDTCNIEVDAYYNKIFKGVVSQISNSLGDAGVAAASTNQVTNFLVTVDILPESYEDLKDKAFPFRPGMSASVDIITEREIEKVAVPILAVFPKTQEEYKEMIDDSTMVASKDRAEYAFLVKNGKANIVPVTTGFQDNEHIVIEQGVSIGDTIIIAPLKTITDLKHEEQIQIVDEDDVYE